MLRWEHDRYDACGKTVTARSAALSQTTTAIPNWPIASPDNPDPTPILFDVRTSVPLDSWSTERPAAIAAASDRAARTACTAARAAR
jgi:hypothetical protein